MNNAARPPKVPPPWFVHTAGRAHRALYRLSGGRFLWTTSNKRGWVAVQPQLDAYAGRRSTETPVVVLEPRDGTA